MKEISFYLENELSYKKLSSDILDSHCVNKKLGVSIVHDGYILPFKKWDSTGSIADGGIVDKNGKLLSGTSFGWDRQSAIYGFERKEVAISNVCIFLGYFHPVYGHAITDALKKLWFFQTKEGKSLINQGAEIVFITTSNKDLPAWHLHLLEIAGINILKCKHIKKIYKYKKIIVPDSSWWRRDDGIITFTNEFRSTINIIKLNIKSSAEYKAKYPPNIYFTRSALNDVCRELGEYALESIFKKNGFTVFSPEELSLEQQISMLMKCKRFAATEGSCSHAQVFCDSNAEVIILRKADYVNSYSMAIADFANCKTVFVDASHSVMSQKEYPWRGPFYLTVTKELREYTGLNIGLPYYYRPTYWLYRYQFSLVGKKLLYIYYLLRILKRKLYR